MKDAPVRHAIEFGCFQLLRGFVRILPHSASRSLGSVLGSVAYRLMSGRRRIALGNLALALPELTDVEHQRIAKAAFRQMMSHATEFLSWNRFDAVQLCERWTLEGWEHLTEATREHGPLFLMTGHLGPWELLPHAVAQYLPSVSALVRRLDNPRLDAVVSAQRTRFGLELIHKHGAARRLMRRVQGGGHVIVLVDQRVKPRDSVEVPFFGRPARTANLIARLALKNGTPVVPIFVYPEPNGRYRIVARPAIPADASGDDPVRELTGRYLEAVEAEVRQHPEVWLWMHDRWRST